MSSLQAALAAPPFEPSMRPPPVVDSAVVEEQAGPSSSTSASTPSSASMPLNSTWTMWWDNPRLADPDKEWAENLVNCGSFDSVESFWSIFNNLKPASALPIGSNYHVFRKGIMPTWEHDANKDGGKFVLSFPKKDSKAGRSDEWWLHTVLAIIGETLDMDGDEVCGAVVSIRKSQDRIALWLKSSDKGRASKVGARWKKCLEMNRTIMKFELHAAAAASGRSYRNTCEFEV